METATVAGKTLEALYVINKKAREYANNAHRHYMARGHYAATRNSVRKKALYKLKSKVLSRLVEKADEIEKHLIDDQPYYCFYFGNWSFHAPTDQIHVDSSLVEGETKILEDFRKSAKSERSSKSLKSCLLHLESEFGISANQLLSKKRVGRYFTGWKYLSS